MPFYYYWGGLLQKKMIEELLVYDCNLNIKSFIQMLDDPTECYKFYWLDSIIQLLIRGDESITFDKVIYGMIADAWFSVSKCNLKLGPRNINGESANSIERAVRKLEKLNIIADIDTRDEIIFKIKKHKKELHDEIYQLSKNVPYRLLSSFLTLGGNDPLWDNKTNLIAYIDLMNKSGFFPYTIGQGRGLDKSVIINNKWKDFLCQNSVTIRAWIKVKKIEYLQARNPGVPEVANKLGLDIEGSRNLQKVRKLWACVAEIVPVYDYFSKKLISDEDYEIDHFIPRSYVSHNELWNLMPLEQSMNSQKNNKLPEWCSFENFATNQFLLNNAIYKYPEIRAMFNECKTDHLKAIWAQESLYIYGISIDEFKSILLKQIKPLYDSASNLGYKVWNDKLHLISEC